MSSYSCSLLLQVKYYLHVTFKNFRNSKINIWREPVLEKSVLNSVVGIRMHESGRECERMKESPGPEIRDVWT